MVSFFNWDGDRLAAQQLAVSPWAPSKLSGTGICGVLARELETQCPVGFTPARLTVDLYQPVSTSAFDLSSVVVRQGSRIAVVDASLSQDGHQRARASAVFLTAADQPPGHVWSPEQDLPVPPQGCSAPQGSPPLFKSGDSDWTSDFAANQNAERKATWQSLPPLVDGEPITAFQRAAIMGDVTSLVCHWGSEGAGYINTDVTVALSRLPVGHELGLRADSTIAAAGVSIGAATLYDRQGPVGTCVVTALSNARRQIDFAATSSAELSFRRAGA
ncbi:acyl-CoA thioesterase domain-containing protein [Nocardia coubleae]|uniref:Thioesterase family protein n=1 Tax=Nocardia coubleae TaxID=356147 RepID=A0A846W119_9NOCA|nr:acyl-CoA thioesterase domain-containing protein [Nocardia coubleae]NKX86821.1 thioesterase family protein [Nocardia coubleae]